MPLVLGGLAGIVACTAAQDRPGGTTPSSPAEAGLGPKFQSHLVEANGVRLRYVRGGSGPAVILLHGFPQDWSGWRRVMPSLATQFTVVAVDLRGIGGSEPTESGYDAASLATDIHQLARQLGLERPYIVGHDVGGMVPYAYARVYPQDARGVMVLDFPLPGIEPWAQVERDPALWHFHFHQTPRLPEALVAGRQVIYFRDFLDRIGGNPGVFSDADVARYAKAYASPGSLRAAFEFYRAFPQTARWNESQTNTLDLPIVLAGADRGVGPLLETAAADLRRKGARHVAVEIVSDSGHWVADERPEQVSALIARHGTP